MEILQHSFFVLKCNGMWRPIHCPLGWKTKLYNTYTYFTMFLVLSLTVSQFFEFATSMDDVDAFAENTFMLLTMIGVCGKALNILNKRAEIIELTKTLQRDPCKPKSDDELTIQRKFDELVRSNTLRYTAVVGIAVSSLITRSFVDDIPRRTLPYNAWLPFEYHESQLGYSIAYSHQIVALAVGASIHVAFDTLVTGFMMQTSGQLHILKHRFREMPINILDRLNCGIPNSESTILSESVRHHIEIFKFAKTLNDLFGTIIFLQYTVSTIVLCVSVFKLSRMELFSAEFTSCLLYLTSMLIQIFIFCFYGGEGTIESIDVGNAIYEMNWTTLSIRMRRSLLTIMARTLRPIAFTSFYLITLNLDSFNSILKLSYSAYNVLQQNG